jgi:hypothetical protein
LVVEEEVVVAVAALDKTGKGLLDHWFGVDKRSLFNLAALPAVAAVAVAVAAATCWLAPSLIVVMWLWLWLLMWTA